MRVPRHKFTKKRKEKKGAYSSGLQNHWERGRSMERYIYIYIYIYIFFFFEKRGNVGDQWSDLLGENVGYRTFKVPNPMYNIS